MSFLTVGMGDEVLKWYRRAWGYVGLNKLFRCGGTSALGGSAGGSSWFESFGDKAKLIFPGKQGDTAGSL